MIRPACIALLVASPAIACEGLTVFSCETENGKHLQICADETSVRYSFGPEGAPELTLANPLATPGYTPWPGVGRTVWESFTFPNAAYRYTVYRAIDRMSSEDGSDGGAARETATVTVFEDEKSVAQLSCRAGTIEAEWGALYDHLTGRGVCFDHAARDWAACE